jgi:hypothetical protein
MKSDLNLEKPKAFAFPEPRQAKIHEALKRTVGDATAAFYKDACKIYSGSYDLESETHLIGHLLREILGSLTEILLPKDYITSDGDNENERKVNEIITRYKIDINGKPVKLWLDITKNKKDLGLHRWAHRSGQISVRTPDKRFEDLWQKIQILFEFLLDVIEKNYLHYVDYLDKLLAKKQITSRDISELKDKIPCNAVTLGYFFDRLDKPECLPLLNKKGFFSNPTPPLDHPDGGISFPYWAQTAYFIKMSKIPSTQDKVLQICLGIETENINTQTQILEVALNLPPEMSAQLVTHSYKWLDRINSWFHPEKYGQLIVHLAEGGQKKEALELVNRVLAVKPDPRKPVEIEGHAFPYEPVALFDDWHYEQILEKNYPTFIDLVGLDAIKVLLSILESFISLSDSDRKVGSKDDYSEIWRPAIEDHAQNHKHGVRDLLITAIRDAYERFLQSKPNQVLAVVNDLESRKLNIFRRLSLHLLRLFPKGAKKKIAQVLMDKKEFDGKSRLTHEYYLLAETHGKMLNKAQRAEIWSWIISGADIESYKKWRIQNGHKPTDEEITKYVKNWQLYHLIPFKSIDAEWEKYFDSLVAVVGQPEYPSFSSWSSGGSWGYTSVVSSEQLKEMDTNKVVDFLKNWQPPVNDPLDRSKEGTGRELTGQVSADPERWLKSVSAFSQLDPTYVRSLLVGYRDALKQEKTFNWKPILDLCEIVLSKPIKIKDRKPTAPFGDDPDWSWCRNTIVELLDEGMKKNTGHISVDLRSQVWRIIEELTKDPNPTPEYEKEYLTSHNDPLSLAINSTRGDAMGAAIQYGVWLKEFVSKENQKTWSFKKDTPELLKSLDFHLDIAKEPSLAIRAIYGEKLGTLAWLDKGWIKTRENIIFPEAKEEQKYFDASWETYITFVNPFKELLKILNKQYRKALQESGSHADTKHHLESPDQRLAQHLMVFYWVGEIDFGKDGLLDDFFKTVPSSLRGEAIEFIGRNLKDAQDVPSEVKTRLKKLWGKRLKAVKNMKKNKDNLQELAGFSWWFASDKFDDKWLLDQLIAVLKLASNIEGDHLVMEKLVQVAQQYPLEAIQVTKLMVDADKKGWGVLSWKEELHEVIKTVLSSANKKAISLAQEFVNRLAAKGYLEFKSLVQKS